MMARESTEAAAKLTRSHSMHAPIAPTDCLPGKLAGVQRLDFVSVWRAGL